MAGGQGTIGYELLTELPAGPMRVYIPVGGGGLCSGVTAVLKSYQYENEGERGSVHIVGCQPANSNVMEQSVAAGKILELESKDTLSGGTAGELLI